MENIAAKIKRLGFQETVPREFQQLCAKCVDTTFIMMGKTVVDTIQLDEELSKIHKEYDHENCTLNGEPSSMDDAILHFYGEEAVKMVEALYD